MNCSSARLQFYSILLVLVPTSILLRNVFSLIALPLNIPLKIFTGSSIQQIILGTNISITNYIAITICQYLVVLISLGTLIGLSLGGVLITFHSIFVIPNVYLDLSEVYKAITHQISANLPFIAKSSPDKTAITIDDGSTNKIMHKPTGNVETSKRPGVLTPQTPPHEIFDTYQSNPYTDGSDISSNWRKQDAMFTTLTSPLSSSRENVLNVATNLPSDFFQEKEKNSNSYNISMFENMYTPSNNENHYISSAQSPRQFKNRQSSSTSSSMSDLLDPFSTITVPTTLRTRRDHGTLVNRKAAYSGNILKAAKAGLFQDA
ncbi:Ldb16p NDAI_0G04150 [Naumovozyma dairenensis CBS 421]|uniref:Uncharacterized protein n=1 Tax=Naumovozyma dairenensis (strain ATCC 10597 / BCRC 20456 / CBS 421 / NBRC 0211 / NRRL Y-12639) TaxID=1071378 RepID=J7SBM1_NAUDC|nr:hypothetical protein NDAI_0G04150 [Naumovozyma dairenensis CBS 421]CCK73400.1 hypothetical protein NDAI_0G04150 [Naumovozyma dairenensis CBS 421]